MNNEDAIRFQQKVADFTLSKLFTIDPYAIVAGGAPRDWYFGNRAADIDVFFHVSPNIPIGMVDSMLKIAGIKVNGSPKCAEYLPEHYKKNPSLRAVFNCYIDGQIVQIMLMRDSTFNSVIDKFPLSICKVWYKGGKLHTTKDFLRSVKFKAIYKTNEIYNNEHAYIQKIIDKFPEFKYYDSFSRLAAEVLD